jgi:hypothetical protein
LTGPQSLPSLATIIKRPAPRSSGRLPYTPTTVAGAERTKAFDIALAQAMVPEAIDEHQAAQLAVSSARATRDSVETMVGACVLD